MDYSALLNMYKEAMKGDYFPDCATTTYQGALALKTLYPETPIYHNGKEITIEELKALEGMPVCPVILSKK